LKFAKMHGLGNDYIYVDCFSEKVDQPERLARIISDRHFGVGGDGLILIMPSQKADVRMRIFNADGSEAEMCGNGIRCLAKYTYEHKLARSGESFAVPGQAVFPVSLNIETGNGILTVGLLPDENNIVQQVCVNMGQPVLSPRQIPVNLTGEKVIEYSIDILGHELLMTCVSMGNPHAVFFCDDVSSIELEKIGPIIEHHKLFPRRTNVHFVQINTPNEFTMRTWERGSGITLACGTGACACCVAAVLTGQQGHVCTAHLLGGDLNLNWCKEDNCVYMTGPAVEVFHGIWPDIKY
jgi:diaminopimelate epimerase